MNILIYGDSNTWGQVPDINGYSKDAVAKQYPQTDLWWFAMSKENKTKDKLISWAAGYVSKASNLEKACDKKMDDVVVRLENLIRENDGDLTLVDTVVYTYANEKSLKKAWYMSELEKRGLIK